MRVVVADNHPAICFGLKEMLLRTDMRVVGESGNGEEVLRLVEELQPNLVILGLNLVGEMSVVEACRRIKALPNAPRVLVYTAYDFTDELSSSLLFEADGYLHKRACRDEILEAIRRTAAGERTWLPSDGTREPRSHLHAIHQGVRLTPKEREVLVLVMYGCSNGKIAEKLYLGLPTVKTHVRSILRKLGVSNRRELFSSHVSEAVNF